MTRGKSAEILADRGQSDQALQFLKEEVLPIFEKLKDVESQAVTLSHIASIFVENGRLDEALRILQEDALPVYEKLGDVRNLVGCRVKTGMVLLRRGRPGDVARGLDHLRWALAFFHA